MAQPFCYLRRFACRKTAHGPFWRTGTRRCYGGGRRNDPRYGAGKWPGILGKDPTDLVVAMVTCLLTIVLVRQPRRLPKWILPVLDAVGLAVFVGIGVNKAFIAGTGPLVAICMGVLTGVGGGIIRDILAREVLMILRTEIYATACIIGDCSRHGVLHLCCPAGECGDAGDGGHAGDPFSGDTLAPEAADVCAG